MRSTTTMRSWEHGPAWRPDGSLMICWTSCVICCVAIPGIVSLTRWQISCGPIRKTLPVFTRQTNLAPGRSVRDPETTRFRSHFPTKMDCQAKKPPNRNIAPGRMLGIGLVRRLILLPSRCRLGIDEERKYKSNMRASFE